MKKNSFILYTYQAETLSDLSFEQKGRLLTALFAYASGEEPEITDQAVKVAFAFIRVQIERDKEKYTDVCEKRRNAARNRWQGKTNRCKPMQTDANAHFADANNYDNEYDSDNELSSPDVDDNKKEPTTTTKKIDLEEEIENLKTNRPLWNEMILMKHHINKEELSSWLDQFVVHCRSRDITHNDEKDLIRHFDDWLRIVISVKREEEMREDNKAAKKQRRANNVLSDKAEDFHFKKF